MMLTLFNNSSTEQVIAFIKYNRLPRRNRSPRLIELDANTISLERPKHGERSLILVTNFRHHTHPDFRQRIVLDKIHTMGGKFVREKIFIVAEQNTIVHNIESRHIQWFRVRWNAESQPLSLADRVKWHALVVPNSLTLEHEIPILERVVGALRG